MARARPGCVSLSGKCPDGNGTCEFWISMEYLARFFKYGMMDKYKEAHLVKEILADPAVVFRGLKREGQEDSYCYVGLASCRYTKDGNELPPPPGKTFAIYVRADLTVFRWGWEPADANLTYPEDYRERFEEQTWPKP